MMPAQMSSSVCVKGAVEVSLHTAALVEAS